MQAHSCSQAPITKKDLLSDFESSHHKLESFGNGPMDVQVFGNVAVVHAGVAEKRIQDTIAALAPTQFVYDKRPPVDPDDDQLPVRPPLSVCSRPMLQ